MNVDGIRIHVGCGTHALPGWLNLDNSATVRLAAHPWLVSTLLACRAIQPGHARFAAIVRRDGVRWADAARRIPAADGSASVVYSCHVLEHMDRDEATGFLNESRRVLRPGGIFRVVVPDLEIMVRAYVGSGDADALVDSTLMATESLRGLAARLKAAIIGHRFHRWMYDARSLSRLLSAHGFERIRVLAPGETTIPDPGPLDLYDHNDGSVYVEARRG